jgi:hypothetical protein
MKSSTRERFLFGVCWLAAMAAGGPSASAADVAAATEAGLQVGVGSVCITPTHPIWMAGYGGRTKRSEGKYQDLFVKALAVKDGAGRRAVIVTSDLECVASEWREPVLRQIKERFGLKPDQILINASHTHCGPVINKFFYPEWDPEYTATLAQQTVDAIARALNDMEDGRLWMARGSCTLSVNRRRPLPDNPGRVDYTILPNPQGLTDPDVPVLKATRKNGTVKAILFLYACHPTTMGGYLFGGDYAGFAQQFLEKEYPGAVALFLQGCGGDIKPRNIGANGRFKDGPLPVVEGFGRELAQAVTTALAGKLVPVQGAVATREATLELPVQAVPSRDELEKRAAFKDWRGEWARNSLATLKAGKSLANSLPEIVQVITIGDAFTLVGLSGEACVEYALRLKRELGREVWVAGYSNDVSAYIPSARMIPEGGYEAERSLTWSVLPTPFRPELEELIILKVHELVRTRKP